jgi:hypothetical protein
MSRRLFGAPVAAENVGNTRRVDALEVLTTAR